jgi:alkanesulfonate monooxygenase SsuD/methylene tetrahydromethanopterin reductase-like flavin-dependent oxidoreductase (luciferase family)
VADGRTDLGLHGFPPAHDGADWLTRAHRTLDDLPPVFTSVWLSDHLQVDGDPQPDVWTRLTWLAATFPRYRVGTMVMSQSYRNPGLLGVMASTLQDLSDGRFVLGLGAGWLEEEYRAFHFDYPSGGTRVAQLGEVIELLKTLWTTSPATYQGQWYGITDAVCEPPDPPIPIMVGTNGPKALKVVARLADWWLWDGPWESTYREPFERLRAECEAIGRPFESIHKVAELAVELPDDPSGFVSSYEHRFYPGQVFGIAGPTPADVIREIEQLVDVGVEHVVLGFEDEPGFRRFVTEVVPHVRLTIPA